MTAATTAATTTPTPTEDLAQRSPFGHFVSDTLVITRRYLLHITRLPQLIVFATIQPILFVLMFNYVFGGNFTIPGYESYTDFLLPGIFVQTVVFGALQTGIGLATDSGTGIIERFKTLPMSRSALLTGRTLSDLVRNVFVVLLMFLMGLLVGMRPTTGPLSILAALGIVLLFSFAMSWAAAALGLKLGDAESAQAASFPLLFPLVFASASFSPTQTMPGWLQAFANNQPVTHVVNAARALLYGSDTAGIATGTAVLKAVLWSALITAIFAPIAARLYRRT